MKIGSPPADRSCGRRVRDFPSEGPCAPVVSRQGPVPGGRRRPPRWRGPAGRLRGRGGGISGKQSRDGRHGHVEPPAPGYRPQCSIGHKGKGITIQNGALLARGGKKPRAHLPARREDEKGEAEVFEEAASRAVPQRRGRTARSLGHPGAPPFSSINVSVQITEARFAGPGRILWSAGELENR